MKLKKVFLLGAVAATVLSACSDESENFHQDAVKDYLNRLNSYKASFMSVYGDIDPNQCWDFTKQSAAPTTRAIDPEFAGFWTEDYVLETVFDEHEAIKEIFSNLREDNDNRSKAVPFVFVVPDEDIVITPQFQGKNSWTTVELHMVVNDGQTVNDYIVWEKNKGMQIKKYSNSQWTDVSKNSTAGTTMFGTAGVEDAVNKPVYAVRSKQLVIPRGTFTPGATITLYTHDKKSSGAREYYWYSTDIKDSHVGDVYKYGKSIGYVKADTQAENVTYVACEGGENKDLNDLIFKMEGITPVPLVEPYWFKDVTAKRYMVEDLGATSASDIDFNDIVVDFNYSFEKEFEIIDSETEHARIRLTGNTRNYVLESTIRSLGGVLDMEMYTLNGQEQNILFKKSASTTVGNWTWNNLSALDYQTMYNTGWASDPYHYNPKAAGSRDSWIGKTEIKSDKEITLWEPAKNNIMIKVYPTGTTTGVGENEYSDANAKSPYLITFPENGTVPCMVAFRPIKQWRLERDGITKDESQYWFKNTSNFFPGEYYAE